MGNRGNVQVKYSEGADIYFYTHWSGSNLDTIVHQALIRGESRWSDESYLARIIFSEMIKGSVEDTTGYGISPYECESGSPKVIVDCKHSTITDIQGNTYSFKDYIERRTKNGH